MISPTVKKPITSAAVTPARAISLGLALRTRGQDVGGRAARWAAGGSEKVLVVGLEGGHVAIRCQRVIFCFRLKTLGSW